MGRRSRSPNYPRLSLEEAVERVSRLYKVEQRHPIDKQAVAEGLGYTSLNGASLGVISTLRQYDLLEAVDEDLRVSEDAVAVIMLPKGDPERAEAIYRTAFAPRLFSELREAYGETLPSDVSLRYALIKKGFSEKAANEVIRVYRDTLELVAEEAAEYTEVVDDARPEVDAPMQPTQAATQGSVAYNSGFAEKFAGVVTSPATVFQFPLPGDITARIELTGRGHVTQEAFDNLKTILDAHKLTFPKANQLERPAVEESPEQPAIESPDTA